MIEDVYGDYETVKPNYAGINQSPVEERIIINRGRGGETGKRNGRQGRSGKGRDGRTKKYFPCFVLNIKSLQKCKLVFCLTLKMILNRNDQLEKATGMKTLGLL